MVGLATQTTSPQLRRRLKYLVMPPQCLGFSFPFFMGCNFLIILDN